MIAQITFGVKPFPQILPVFLIDRSKGPALMPAPPAELSIAFFTDLLTSRAVCRDESRKHSQFLYFPLLEGNLSDCQRQGSCIPLRPTARDSFIHF